MTSTTRGDFSERNSSRVLRPPGGGSSNIFGSVEDEVKPSKNVGASVIEPQTETPQLQANIENNDKGKNSEEGSADAKSELQPADNSQQRQAIASKHKGGSGFNPITGEASGQAQQPTDNSKQNVRIRQPPGGASTKLW